MLDRVPAPAELRAPDPRCWQAQLTELARAIRRALAAHADIARVALGTVPRAPHGLLIAETGLAILRAGGRPGRRLGGRPSLAVCDRRCPRASVAGAQHARQARTLQPTAGLLGIAAGLPNPETVLELVSELSGARLEVLVGPSRARGISRVRSAAMFLLRTEAGLSATETGQVL